jgi:hypothetical protein
MRVYLGALESENFLPTDFPKRMWGGVRFDTGAFGLGFQQNGSKEFHTIRKDLLEVLDRSFWRINPERVKNLLGLAQSDAGAFVEAIDDSVRRNGVPNYAHDPVLVDADPVEAAELFFSLEPENTHVVLSPFERRVPRLERQTDAERLDKRSERDWLLQVRDATHDLASKTTPIRAEQIRMTIKWHLGFLDKSDEDAGTGGK